MQIYFLKVYLNLWIGAWTVSITGNPTCYTFNLHSADLGLILSTPCSPLSTARNDSLSQSQNKAQSNSGYGQNNEFMAYELSLPKAIFKNK